MSGFWLAAGRDAEELACPEAVDPGEATWLAAWRAEERVSLEDMSIWLLMVHTEWYAGLDSRMTLGACSGEVGSAR